MVPRVVAIAAVLACLGGGTQAAAAANPVALADGPIQIVARQADGSALPAAVRATAERLHIALDPAATWRVRFSDACYGDFPIEGRDAVLVRIPPPEAAGPTWSHVGWFAVFDESSGDLLEVLSEPRNPWWRQDPQILELPQRARWNHERSEPGLDDLVPFNAALAAANLGRNELEGCAQIFGRAVRYTTGNSGRLTQRPDGEELVPLFWRQPVWRITAVGYLSEATAPNRTNSFGERHTIINAEWRVEAQTGLSRDHDLVTR